MATMDEKRPITTPEPSQVPLSDGMRGERRRRVHEVLSTQRQYLDQLENELTEGLQNLAEEINRSLAQSRAEQLASGQADLQPQVDELNRQLAAQQDELTQDRAARTELQAEISRLEQELRARDVLLHESQAQQEQRRTELATAREQLADLQSQSAAAQERQEQLRRELADEREGSLTAQEETKAERRRMARELKVQHADRLAEFERRKAELASLGAARNAELEAQLTAAQADANQARNESNQLRGSLEQSSQELAQTRGRIAALDTHVAELRQALDNAHDATAEDAHESSRAAAQHSVQLEELTRAQASIDALQRETAELREALAKAQTAGAQGVEDSARAAARDSAHQAELKNLRGERDALAKTLATAEGRLSQRAQAAESETTNDLERRLEMALDELREAKRTNMELEIKLTKSRGSDASSSASMNTGLDWEAQKQRLLASLEADESDDEDAIAERHSIEGTIRITDQIVAKKDEELALLKQRLEELELNPRTSGAKDKAVAEILDRDEIIQQEREKLKQLHAEWREKIGKAETDLSVERAKIARERAELANRMQSYQATAQSRTSSNEPSDAGKPVRGRWLSRLGLKDVDENS
jgi:hypothetical protein